MSEKTMSITKALLVSAAAGALTYGVCEASMKNKLKLKRTTKKAVRSVGSMFDVIGSMMS